MSTPGAATLEARQRLRLARWPVPRRKVRRWICRQGGFGRRDATHESERWLTTGTDGRVEGLPLEEKRVYTGYTRPTCSTVPAVSQLSLSCVNFMCVTRPEAISLLLAGLVAASVISGCDTQRAFNDWVRRQPEAVRFGCSDAPAQTGALTLPVPIQLNDVVAGPNLFRAAGNLDQPPLLVPFSESTPPLAVLKADIQRILEAHQRAGKARTTSRLRQMNITLHVAFADRTFHVVKSSEMRAQIAFDFSIVDAVAEKTIWTQRISEEYTVRPGYITSRSVEEALNGAYCKALATFNLALGSSALRNSLQPSPLKGSEPLTGHP